jgi:aminopeptidase N
LGLILKDQKIDLSYKAYLLELPTLNTMSQNMKEPDFNSLELIRIHLKKLMGSIFFEEFHSDYQKLTALNDQDLTPHGYGSRAYRNQCLSYLVAAEHPQSMDILSQHYFQAANMTDEIHSLQLFIQSGVALDNEVVQGFYKKWQHDSLVMIKWFGAIASFSPQNEVLKRLKILEADKLFQHQVPNYLRALYLQFAKNNLAAFHHESGESYDFLVERIIKIDSYNPHVASRLASAFSLIQKVDVNRQALMRKSLGKVMQASPSRDVFETLSKYL